MKNKYRYKGCQPNADMNATHLMCPFIFQRDGIAKVIKFFKSWTTVKITIVDWIIFNTF